MLDCNWLSDGLLVFCTDSKISYFHDPLGEHICWYLYYIPMILIPVLGLAAAMFLGEKGGRENDQKDYNFADRCSDIDRKVFLQMICISWYFVFPNSPISDKDYSYGIVLW